jgi:hypothetical protein
MLLTAVAATSAFARECPAAGAQSEVDPTVQALHCFEVAMAAIFAEAPRDSAIARLIERVRKVE